MQPAANRTTAQRAAGGRARVFGGGRGGGLEGTRQAPSGRKAGGGPEDFGAQRPTSLAGITTYRLGAINNRWQPSQRESTVRRQLTSSRPSEIDASRVFAGGARRAVFHPGLWPGPGPAHPLPRAAPAPSRCTRHRGPPPAGSRQPGKREAKFSSVPGHSVSVRACARPFPPGYRTSATSERV